MKKIHVAAISGFVLAGCITEESTEKGETIRIAAVYKDTGADSPNVSAVAYAASLVNEGGFTANPIEIVPVIYNDETDIQAKAIEAIGDSRAIGFVSDFSLTALDLIQVTAQDQYQEIVNCSGASTNPALNNPAVPDEDDGTIAADRNDTLYRSVANDKLQIKVMWSLLAEKDKVAVYASDDGFGNGFRRGVSGAAEASGNTIALNGVVPSDSTAAAYTEAVQPALEANRAGTVSTVIVVGFAGPAGQMIKALVEASPPFAGDIVLNSGAVNDATFLSQTASLATWLGTPGNTIRATTADNASGTHSAAFEEALQAATSLGAHDAALPAHVDCLLSMSLALAAGTTDGLSGAAAIKAGMLKQKDSALAAAAETFTVTPTTLGDVEAALAAGKSLRLDGASGVVTYDDNGDRSAQLYSVMAPEGTGPFTWALSQTWDATTGECISGC